MFNTAQIPYRVCCSFESPGNQVYVDDSTNEVLFNCALDWRKRVRVERAHKPRMKYFAETGIPESAQKYPLILLTDRERIADLTLSTDTEMLIH